MEILGFDPIGQLNAVRYVDLREISEPNKSEPVQKGITHY
jgi:hypothetical protein